MDLPPQAKDIQGRKFGRLTAVEYFGRVNGQSVWLCLCDCGNTRKVRRHELMRGDTQSCGCLRTNKDPASPATRAAKRASALRWKAKHPGHWREGQLRRKYGIGWAEYCALLARQRGLCAICGSDKPGGRGLMHVDHDHATGRVRGLLCNACNRAIGQMADDPVRLRAAADYLESWLRAGDGPAPVESGPDPLPGSE